MGVTYGQLGALMFPRSAPSARAIRGTWGADGVAFGDGDAMRAAVLGHVGAPKDGDSVLCLLDETGTAYVVGVVPPGEESDAVRD